MSTPDEIPKAAEFTIRQQQRNDGCTYPDMEEVIKHAINSAGVYTIRQGYARFSVNVDEGRFETNRVDSLRKFLSSISIGSKCKVFRNCARGASIMFHC